ncbi:MAG: phosphodiester glycosidase family protein [Pseudomonadota bacterium]|nr:phosphodiester glycosidase family protein [Pseudomonadota bacterium]
MRKWTIALLSSAAVLAAWSYAAGATARALPLADGWTRLPSGLDLGTFTVDRTPTHGDGRMVVVRVDQARFELVAYTASADGETRTAREWVGDTPGVLAATNASMYEPDQRTASSLLVAGGHINNPTLSADNAVLAFGGTAPARIVDRTCQEFEAVRPLYPSLIQGIRMLGCDGANVWEEQPRRWSEAAIGQSANGDILFLFARTPWSAHAFVEHARGLELELVRLQHADGGPPAQVAWRDGAATVELIGSYETDSRHDDLRVDAVAVPNLVGIRAR